MRNSILAKSLQQSLDRGKAREEESGGDSPAPPPASHSTPSSLRTMSDILSNAAEQAPIEVDVSEIAESEIADRFDVQDGLAELVASISTSGQRLPVLLRHRRGDGPRYEVVYGRRRIAACRALGRRVVAYVRDMSLNDALMSQALENSARLERSFIEQAVFASKLESAGFPGDQVCQALAIDATTLSRLRTVIRDIPSDVIFKIGAAPGVGRRPWMELRELVNKAGPETAAQLHSQIQDTGSPAQRLESLIKWLGAPAREHRQAPESVSKKSGQQKAPAIGSVSARAGLGNLVLKAGRKQDRAFLVYLEARLEALYTEWSGETQGDNPSN
ncbi:plasmid partitioning protein RepB [Amaricoccus solimangrovi]|uniref:Plasmid partitioning protein RepB n=1 Tax=Amaricoccus solimangrovi TaxID=2589815 RepID=A0A501WBF2_9RHOB|nr:plasmid partitioning protein RepB [Amaricoccus solimangrovi]TPE45710.1 plasmid partitioning protein RepB [Amaricoccus solimangrovi]